MILKKHIIAIATALLLASCDSSSRNVNSDYSIPAELSQCTFTRMTSSSGRNMTVVRCPSSTVTVTEHNKAATTTVTIDGNEYVRKE